MYVLTFEPVSTTSREGEGWRMVPPDVRVRRLLKHALRGLGLRCTRAHEESETDPDHEEKPMIISFALEHGRDNHTCERGWPWPHPPIMGETLDLGGCRAIVVDVTYSLVMHSIEVSLVRESDDPMDAKEAAAWRRAGFDVSETPATVEDGPPWEEV